MDSQLNNKRQVIFDLHDQPVRINLKKYQKFDHLKHLLAHPIKTPKYKVSFSKKIVNDYVEIVNKRQDLVDSITQSANNFLKLSSKTGECFAEYYSPGSIHKEKLNTILSLIRPEFKYIKTIANQNNKRINYILSKHHDPSINYEDTTPSSHLKTKKEKLFFLSGPKNNMDTAQSDAEFIKLKQKSENDLQKDDKFTIQYKIALQKEQQKEQTKQNMIQARLFDSQLKYQGDDYIKQTIFKQNMKHSLSPQNSQKDNYFISQKNSTKYSSNHSPMFRTQNHTRNNSQYNNNHVSNNISTEFIPTMELIQGNCNDVNEQFNDMKQLLKKQQKGSFKSYTQLINKSKEVKQFENGYFKSFGKVSE